MMVNRRRVVCVGAGMAGYDFASLLSRYRAQSKLFVTPRGFVTALGNNLYFWILASRGV